MANPSVDETIANGDEVENGMCSDEITDARIQVAENGVALEKELSIVDHESREQIQVEIPKITNQEQEAAIELQDTSLMETSIAESDEVQQSPKKGMSTTSESESDASSDSKVPIKRRKKSNGFEPSLHHQTLKRTLEPFVQKKDCEKLRHLGKCLDCRNKAPRQGRNQLICRFYLFRKLRYTERGSMIVAGFPDSESVEDYKVDLHHWTPDNPPEGMDIELAKFLLQEVGDHFCELVKQEKETIIELNDQVNKRVTWRRVVKSLREMCDVCYTTLFNYHWTCGKCGFVVCVSCFKTRKSSKSVPVLANVRENKDSYGWMRCHCKGEHKLEQLMLTQIIAGRALDDLWTKLHRIRKILLIPENCSCYPQSSNTALLKNETKSVEIVKKITIEAPANKATIHSDDSSDEGEGDELLSILNPGNTENTAVAVSNTNGSGVVDNIDNVPNLADSSIEGEQLCDPEKDDNEASIETNVKVSEPSGIESDAVELKNFVRKDNKKVYCVRVLPKNIQTNVKTNMMFPTVPHVWLCAGYLLRLLDPLNPGNLQMFQEQWKRGQPVIVSNVGTKLDKEIWKPESFSKDFGHKVNILINCMTGKVVPNEKMKKFWDGFEHVKQRLKDDNGEPMLLKLKDWPPGDDFAKVLPDRFKDLMNALPLGEYTRLDGKLNLAARLPDVFCKPDLGPKMYIAYGSGLHLDKGTTNLHLDVSDAVNVMVHVGVVKDVDVSDHEKAVMDAIASSDCDTATINRVTKNKELPGALWHIWEARDADKIRDLINKYALEEGLKVEPHHDAIHDQSWYLDSKLRKRLRNEYNVVGYPILQCEGDAVFIPAGAPHQVRNLNNCIKIAEDFVSPENVGYCFYLTEEFRNLTETHTNHEDKLQIKNIVYHTVKDAVAVVLKNLEESP